MRYSAELQIRCVKLTSIDSTCVNSWTNPMFDHLLESSRWDDSNKLSNIGFGEEIGIPEIKIRTLYRALGTGWITVKWKDLSTNHETYMRKRRHLPYRSNVWHLDADLTPSATPLLCQQNWNTRVESSLQPHCGCQIYLWNNTNRLYKTGLQIRGVFLFL